MRRTEYVRWEREHDAYYPRDTYRSNLILFLLFIPIPSGCHQTPLILSSRDLLDYLGPRGHLDGTRLIIDRVKPEDKGVYRWDTGHLFKMGLRDEYSFTVFRWYICQFFKMAVREEFSFIKKDSDKEMGLYLWARCASFFKMISTFISQRKIVILWPKAKWRSKFGFKKMM